MLDTVAPRHAAAPETHASRVGRLMLALLLSGLLLAGCKSAPATGSTWMASVVIPEVTSSQIRVTAVDVFQIHGYQVKSMTGGEVVFDRPGTRTENVLYGTLSSGVWTRVKVRVRDHGPDARLLECNAYRVENHDDRALETERQLLKSGPYQKLLDEVKARLKR
jgi:hypothetical protein